MNRLKNNGIKTVLVLVMGLLVLAPGALHARLDCYAPEVPAAPCVDTTMGDDEAVDAEASDVIEEEDLGPVYCNKDLYDAVRACNLAAVQEVLARPGAPASFADNAFGPYGSPLHWLITDNVNLNDQARAIVEVLLVRGVSMGVINGDDKRAYEVLTDYVIELRVASIPEPAGGEEHRALIELYHYAHALANWLEVHDELWEAQQILEQQAAAFIAGEDAAYSGGYLSDTSDQYGSDMDCS